VDFDFSQKRTVGEAREVVRGEPVDVITCKPAQVLQFPQFGGGAGRLAIAISLLPRPSLRPRGGNARSEILTGILSSMALCQFAVP
jgi:hypothetical protein